VAAICSLQSFCVAAVSRESVESNTCLMLYTQKVGGPNPSPPIVKTVWLLFWLSSSRRAISSLLDSRRVISRS
jgi:hypothetical protein